MRKKTNDSEIVKLLSSPFIAALNVQSKMIDKYIETVKKIAFGSSDTEEGEGKSGKTSVLKFIINRFAKKGDDDMEKVEQEIEVPLISLISIPALTMKQVTVDLALEVNPSDSELNSVKATSKGGRPSDPTAKYIIKMIAEREAPAAGMNKLTEIMANSMEPMKV